MNLAAKVQFLNNRPLIYINYLSVNKKKIKIF